MNSEEKTTNWGETERGKEGQPIFMERNCKTDGGAPYSPSILLFPFCLPLDHDQGGWWRSMCRLCRGSGFGKGTNEVDVERGRDPLSKKIKEKGQNGARVTEAHYCSS
jgi:hypothetical protein